MELHEMPLPDLEPAVAIEVKNMRIKKFAHIEYLTEISGKIVRILRDENDLPIYLFFVESLLKEYVADFEFIRANRLELLITENL